MSTPQTNQNEKAMVRLSGTMEKFKQKLSQALPKNRNVDQEISSVLATVAASPALQRCTPESIALAAYDAATLGLPVNKLGLAWLVPFGNEAKLQIGYRGYIELVMRTGFVLDIVAECVYENDKFRYTLGSRPTVEHEPTPFGKPRGKVVAVYCVAQLANGISKPCVMTKEQVDHIRAKSKSANNGPWVTDYDEMAKKTVIKRLCKLLPYTLPNLQTVELANEIEERNQAAIASLPPASTSALTVVELVHESAEETSSESDQPVIDVVVEAEPATEPKPAEPKPKTLLQQVLALQDELEALDPKSDKLPGDIERYSDGQYYSLIKKKTAAIVALKASKGKGTAENSHSAGQE